MKQFVYYLIIIQDNKYSPNPHGLLKLIPYGKMYSVQTSLNYRDVMSYLLWSQIA